ncbi:MAG: hypothetical protein HZB53_11005 [Chloroflexi bacterium]|nr:hypothetical protein [Chloroflexota bacterium]
MNGLHLKDRRRRGQAVVLVALMAVALVAFVGLALDGAQVFERRRMMQNAADSGSMAGAYALGNAMARSIIEGQVQSYTVGGGGFGNRADNWEGVFLPSNNDVKTTNPSASDNCVRVTTYVTFGTYFMGIVGFNAMNTSAQATACAGPIGMTNAPLWPMVVHTPSITSPLSYGQVYTLFNDNGTNYQPGTFGWVDFNGGNNNSTDTLNWLNGQSASPYMTYLYSGGECDQNQATSKTMLSIGDCLDGDTGLGNTQNIRDAIVAHQGMSVTVLFYDTANSEQGHKMYHVVGFARLVVSVVNMTGNPKTVMGYFQHYIMPGEICITNCGGVSGVKSVNLTN